MKHTVILAAMGALIISMTIGCSSIQYKSFEKVFRTTLTVQDAVNRKAEYDSNLNPASQSLMLRDLKRSLVEIESTTVKDIIASSLIDYDFTVLVEVSTDRGNIECYVYSTDVKTIASLRKGASKVAVIGDFGRFFQIAR
jgi:hypothetical protein